MFCPKCGKEIIEGTKFCTKCGTPVNFIDTDDINEERKVTPQEIETNEVGSFDYFVKADKKSQMPVVIAASVLIALVVISVGVYFLFFYGNDNDNDSDVPVAYDITEDTVIENAEMEPEHTGTGESAVGKKEQLEEQEAAVETENIEERAAEDTTQDEPSAEKYDALKDLDVENEVFRIREVYNNIQNDCSNYIISEHDWGTMYDGDQYKKVIVKSGYDGNEYERWFFYENDQLIFSFYFSGSNEQRFYFYKSRLFRWKDNDATHDKEYDNSGWYEWEDLILSESAKIMGGKYGISMSDLTAIKASSTLEAEGYDYNAYNLVDGDRTTAWTEGTDGDGINEYVTFQF